MATQQSIPRRVLLAGELRAQRADELRERPVEVLLEGRAPQGRNGGRPVGGRAAGGGNVLCPWRMAARRAVHDEPAEFPISADEARRDRGRKRLQAAVRVAG